MIPHHSSPWAYSLLNKSKQDDVLAVEMAEPSRGVLGLVAVYNPTAELLIALTRIPPPPSFNPLTPNEHYSGRTAPLTSRRCILYIYSKNIGTEYFKYGIYSPFFFSLQNAVWFIILTYLVPLLFTFYVQDVLKLKK